MGRLQRKKDLQKAKRKKSADEGAAPRANAETAADQAVATVVPDKDAGKRQTAPQKKILPVVKSSEGGAVRNFFERAMQFLREVKVELKKVTWPSRKQTLGSTAVVIILVVIISLFLGVVDISLSGLLRLVLK